MDRLDPLVARAGSPLKDGWLEALQEKHLQGRCEPYYRFLYWLVKFAQPEVALEIGVHTGLASAHMCAAAAEYGGWVVGLDINAKPVPEKLLEQRYGNYTFIHKDSTRALPDVEQVTVARGALGVVFQDSSHHYHASRLEWDLYRPLMRNGGFWVCDDITPAFWNADVDPPGKGMVQYFSERSGDKRLYPDLHHGSVIGVIQI